MKRWLYTAFVLTLMLGWSVPVTAAGVPDLKTLRANIDAARGPVPDNYRETLTITAEDGSTETFHTYKFGKSLRTRVDSGPVHWEFGTADGEDWHQDENGITVVDEPDPDSGAAAGASADSGTVSQAATPAGTLVISSVDANGFGTRQYVDGATDHVLREERIRRAGTVTTTYDEYATFGAETLPSRWTVTNSATGTVREIARLERVAGDVSAAQVAEPSIRRALVDFPSNAPVAIPARFNAGQIIVTVTIAGHPLNFILDTGSADIVLDSTTAHDLGFASIDHYSATNAQTADFSDAVVPALTIGTVSMHDIVVSTTPLTDRSSAPGFKVAGLLGFDFLATIGVHIDYEHSTVSVAPVGSYAPPSGPNVVPIDIRLGQQVPTMSVGLDGVVANRFVIDTGNGFGSYLVFDYFMDRHPNVGERSSEAVNGVGIGGTFTAHPFFVHSFRFGTWDFQDFNGFRVGAGSYPQDEDGAIGPEFLVLFNVDLDYPHGRVYLTPTTNTKQMLHMH